MGHKRATWTRLAALAAALMLAMGMVTGIAPAKAWAAVADTDSAVADPTVVWDNNLKINIKGTITDSSGETYYGGNEYGELGTWTSASANNGGELVVSVSGGKTISSNSSKADAMIAEATKKLNDFLGGAGSNAIITGPEYTVENVYTYVNSSHQSIVYESLDSLLDAWKAENTPDPDARVVVHKYCTVAVTGSATAGGEEPSSNYTMISGDGSVWTQGSSAGLTFVSDAPFDEFSGIVVVDDEQVPADCWTASAGSTKVELKPAYLQKLGLGDHEVSIVSQRGVAVASFTVKAAAAEKDQAKDGASAPAGGASEPAAAAGSNAAKKSPKTGALAAPLAATAAALGLGAAAARRALRRDGR